MPKKIDDCESGKCIHARECDKRVNQILRTLTTTLTKRFAKAEEKGEVQRVAEIRAQAVVLSALAIHTRGFIAEEDEENIDAMTTYVATCISDQLSEESLPN